jgi:hypothetical protein
VPTAFDIHLTSQVPISFERVPREIRLRNQWYWYGMDQRNDDVLSKSSGDGDIDNGTMQQLSRM